MSLMKLKAAAGLDHKHSQRGFTLVELAIVLVIIGLIIGAVLKGQELIVSARLKTTISDIDSIRRRGGLSAGRRQSPRRRAG